MNNVDRIVVKNTVSGEIGEVRRTLFESSVFNPGGLLLIEVEDTRGGCVDCGVEPCIPQDEVVADDGYLEDNNLDEEED